MPAWVGPFLIFDTLICLAVVYYAYRKRGQR